MRPSEIINKVFEAKPNEMCSDNVYLGRAFGEIGKILDKLYCEHKSAYQVDSGDIFYNVCNDCGILFLAKK